MRARELIKKMEEQDSVATSDGPVDNPVKLDSQDGPEGGGTSAAQPAPEFKYRELPTFANDSVEKENGMVPVFVFETLMNKKLRKMLLKREVGFEVDAIPNYREISLETPEGSDYHTIVSSEGDKVKGQILFVTDSELAILDDWEDQYQRVPVYMESGRKAWVYVLKVSKMKDFGQNIDVELNDDDLKLIDLYLKEEYRVVKYVRGRTITEGRWAGRRAR